MGADPLDQDLHLVGHQAGVDVVAGHHRQVGPGPGGDDEEVAAAVLDHDLPGRAAAAAEALGDTAGQRLEAGAGRGEPLRVLAHDALAPPDLQAVVGHHDGVLDLRDVDDVGEQPAEVRGGGHGTLRSAGEAGGKGEGKGRAGPGSRSGRPSGRRRCRPGTST